MKIVIFGANGYIGHEVAVTLRRRGHDVHAVVRKEEYVDEFMADEITAIVIADYNAADDRLHDVVRNSSVVIDCLPPVYETNRKLFEISKANNALYVYTSGVLCYGNTLIPADERHPARSDRVWPRIEFEKDVLRDGGVVLRPGYVYGKSYGAYASGWFNTNDNNTIQIEGNPKRIYSMIHIVDLANAYVCVIEAPQNVVRGEIFNITDESRLTYEQLRILCAEAYAGTSVNVEYVDAPDHDWGVFSNVSAVVISKKLREYFNWAPLSGPFEDHLKIGALALQARRRRHVKK